ncbi:ATP-binding protein [Streptomyces sp. NPDC058740]|uniref:ATP-binding protein n=1 Tax=Streptomyces sp. NPDC058740 TaxID=3346619 RepID=UPI003690AC3B
MRLLPAQRDWVNQVCEFLIDGETVIARGVPGSGKTVLLEAVARELGDTSVRTRGRAYTDANQEERTAAFHLDVFDALDRHGAAQLLFDDYPHALRNTQGLRLQRQLLKLLVDGDQALDIGALLTGRWGRSMHLISTGSPLVARARAVALPVAGEADFEAVGCARSADAVASVGGNSALLSKVAPVLGRVAFHQVCEAAEILAPKWVQDVPWEAATWIKGVLRDGPAPLPADDSATEALAPLLVPAAEQRYGVVRALHSEAARVALDGRVPTWPANWRESVKTFCGFLSGVPEAIWVDRYMAVNPEKLLRFVEAVRSDCGTPLRMLIAENRNDIAFTAADVAAFEQQHCEVRVMHRGDRRQLHDRQLIFLGDLEGGIVLPTARVLMCQDPPGSAVAVKAPTLDRKLMLDAWDRASPPRM